MLKLAPLVPQNMFVLANKTFPKIIKLMAAIRMSPNAALLVSL